MGSGGISIEFVGGPLDGRLQVFSLRQFPDVFRVPSTTLSEDGEVQVRIANYRPRWEVSDLTSHIIADFVRSEPAPAR